MPMLFKRSTNYYCLVAGLPDLFRDDTKLAVPFDRSLQELEENLSKEDAKRINLLFAQADNDNFLRVLEDREAELNPEGRLTSNDWEDLLNLMKEDKNLKDPRLMPYMLQFYEIYTSEEGLPDDVLPENYLAGLYYQYGIQTDNEFMSNWFEFNLNLNNLITAINCRKHQIEPVNHIVGDTDLAKVLKTSHSRDFGVSFLFPYTNEVIKLMEEDDLLEREKKIDALKWDWLEEHSFFHYFSIERIITYVLKLEMIKRWNLLSFDEGMRIFRQALDDLKPESLEVKQLIG